MLIRPPRLVLLDTSHLTGLAADHSSADPTRRQAAQSFRSTLIAAGWLMLLSWHQLEELIQHRDDELVDRRLQFLRDMPMLAWVSPFDSNSGPGSVIDILATEASAAQSHPEVDVMGVRDLARAHLISFGPGDAAVHEGFRDWRLLREALQERQERTRRTAAISPWRAANIGNTLIGDWLKQPLRDPADATRILNRLRNDLADEITRRGDKRIADPEAMANEFFAEVIGDGSAVATSDNDSPALQFLLNFGLDLDDIDPAATFDETMDKVVFLRRLRVISEAYGLPLGELRRAVSQSRLPVTVIEYAIRRYGQDQPERKGSDLNDAHLLCLAPYADVTYVDKRTLESVRRARPKDPTFSRLVGKVEKAANYREIGAALARQ